MSTPKILSPTPKVGGSNKKGPGVKLKGHSKEGAFGGKKVTKKGMGKKDV